MYHNKILDVFGNKEQHLFCVKFASCGTAPSSNSVTLTANEYRTTAQLGASGSRL
jgi:hypothetical protein